MYAAFLPALSKEYAFWMEGADTLEPGKAHRRVVRLDDGTLLNRYWDDRDSPREESYREDVETARTSNRPAAEVYRDLRAAAESGWDFSSRWLADGKSLATINTTALVPVDLNSLLFHLETILAKAYAASRKPERAAEFRARAALRKAAVRRYLWDAREGIFTDYLWREGKPTGKVTAASLYPLFFGLATQAQADRVAQVVRSRLLKPGGLVTTTVQSGQQWDAPEWLGAIAVDRDRGPECLRQASPCPNDRAALDRQGHHRLSQHRQAHGKIQRGEPFARGRRRGISGPGRFWLDEWRGAKITCDR